MDDKQVNHNLKDLDLLCKQSKLKALHMFTNSVKAVLEGSKEAVSC